MTKPPSGPAADALARIEAELGGALGPPPGPAELAALETACAGDPERLRRWLKRRLAGEPLAYILGWLEFRGLRFAVDSRAYITDPELTHLVDAVLNRVRTLPAAAGQGPLLAEVGVGCGSLALALKRALPAARIVGLDLHPGALALAASNASAHGLELRLVESDLFESWPADLPPPDLIYGDPPWGDAASLYAEDRPAAHYLAMPAASAFPIGGRTGVHSQILRAVAARGWASEIWLNGGILSPDELRAAAAAAPECEIVAAAPRLSLLRCRMAK